MRKRQDKIVGITMLLVVTGCTLSQPLDDSLQSRRLAVGEKIVTVRVADTVTQQTEGLAGVISLSDEEGMLFAFPDKRVRTFWMKGMLISIDILWIDGDEIVGIEHDVPPPEAASRQPFPLYHSPRPADTVLEVRAGFARAYGVDIGDRIKYR